MLRRWRRRRQIKRATRAFVEELQRLCEEHDIDPRTITTSQIETAALLAWHELRSRS